MPEDIIDGVTDAPGEAVELAADVAEEVAGGIADVSANVADSVASASTATLDSLSEALTIQARTNNETMTTILGGINSLQQTLTELASRSVEAAADVVTDVGEIPEEITDVVIEGDAPGPINHKKKRRLMRHNSR